MILTGSICAAEKRLLLILVNQKQKQKLTLEKRNL